MRYRDKWPVYAKEINSMAIKPNRMAEFKKYAEHGIANKAIYQEIEQASGVPWYSIVVIHIRESNAKFSTYLGNGDPLNRPTTHVPRGRGPFSSFKAGALDALHIDGLDKVVPPWPIEKILYWNEIFNGAGYHNMGIPSPYIWGGTTIQRIGKYTSDGHFNPTVWDTQPGCAGILWMIGYLDTSVNYTRET